jgi:hypothetical protein
MVVRSTGANGGAYFFYFNNKKHACFFADCGAVKHFTNIIGHLYQK